MSFDKDSAVKRAKEDLAKRIESAVDQIQTSSVADQDFPDMSLGAPVEGEMSAQMIASGWKIILKADGQDYEYRADKYQLRLCGFDGSNHVIVS